MCIIMCMFYDGRTCDVNHICYLHLCVLHIVTYMFIIYVYMTYDMSICMCKCYD